MHFMNEFVQTMTAEMHAFLRAVSTSNREVELANGRAEQRSRRGRHNCHESIDLGYELTMMHKYLSEFIEDHPEVRSDVLYLLNSLVHRQSDECQF